MTRRYLIAFAFVLLCLCQSYVSNAEPSSLWSAHWIGPPRASNGKFAPDEWICYRTTFELGTLPKSAIARIAVDSRYYLYVNGNLAVFEGGLKRGPNPTDTYFDQVDVASYLRPGKNTIAILHCYWGVDGFSHKSSGQPGLLFELNAGPTLVISDTSWKMRVHPSYGHAGGKQPNMRISERPIRFDARKDMESWTTSYFVDSDWANASDFGLPPAAPWNHLHERPIPLWKNGGLVPYATTDAATPGIVRCSLPYNAQVTPYLKVEAHAGEMIEIDSDDPLNEMHVEYIARDGVQEYEAPAWMNGHNIIYKIPVSVKVLRLLYRESGFDTEFSGSFECDDPFLTTLWKQCARTLYVTMRDNFMDCPDRERGQWWGDAVNEIGETFYSLSPSSASLAQKAIYNLTEWQKPDGTIFSPVPAGNWSTELPTQMLASVGQYGFWTYFLYTGDLKTIKEVYPAVKKYLSVWKIGGDGLVVHRPGGWDWLDWGDNIDVAVLDNAWFALALSGAKSMALAAGYPADSLRYSQMYDALSAAVNRKLWNGTEYREPVHKGPPDDRANGLAVVSGIVSNEKFAAITQLLQEQKWASPYMEKYVLESLVIMGRTDLALKRMHERYKEAVESGLSTLPETFPLGGTMNHAWSGGPLTILSQYVAGIAPIVPGYTSFSIKPNYGGLNHIRAAVDTKRGKIVVQLDRKVKMQTCTVEAPTGSIAYVSLPTGGGNLNSVRVNGVFWKPNSSSPKFKANSYNLVGNRVVFRLSSGRWLIELAD